MKKSELKFLIKECVKEVLFEDGVLAGLVTEVMVGMTKAQMLTESKPAPLQDKSRKTEKLTESKKINETRKRMAEALGDSPLGEVFNDVEPIRESKVNTHSPLANTDPTNAGVNISGIMNVAGNAWKRLK